MLVLVAMTLPGDDWRRRQAKTIQLMTILMKISPPITEPTIIIAVEKNKKEHDASQ